jgi:hypothetical protein
MALRTLSSRLTFLSKYLFSILWAVLFGFVILALWTGQVGDQRIGPLPPEAKLAISIFWVVVSAQILYVYARLKRVRVDEQSMYISNYLEDVAVPLDAIDRVTENRWVNIRPITVHFRQATPFGDKITFMPKSRFIMPWSSHPTARELRQLAHLADS